MNLDGKDLISKKCFVVTSSINELHNLVGLEGSSDYVNIVVIDEGDARLRRKNQALLEGKSVRFYGPQERREWFIERFGPSKGDVYSSLIPRRCHAETSFGFLLALEENPDFIVQIDDDAWPENPRGFLAEHFTMLMGQPSQQVSSANRWYNTLDMLEIYGEQRRYFPRGHPYSARGEVDYEWDHSQRPSVLHMGHWLGVPDLDALTYIETGFLSDDVPLRGIRLSRPRVVVAPHTYFSICSMNASFIPEIIPAFYQFYMNHLSVDRFDDIWSGIILKKVADHLGDRLSIGAPLVMHRKRPRDLFIDLANEARGMGINEILWQVIDEASLTASDYPGCYFELAEHLVSSIDRFGRPYRSFLKRQCKNMLLWGGVCEKLV